MKYVRILALLSTLVVGGCASNPMLLSYSPTVDKPESDEAQVVFLRSSFVGNTSSASLYDVTNERIKFIGIIANRTKVVYNTKPGKHTFMIVSDEADFMLSDLQAGKTYYSLVSSKVGAWTTKFSLLPIRNDKTSTYNTSTLEFRKWLSETKLATLSDEAVLWYRENRREILSKKRKYQSLWQQQPAEDIAQKTLNPQDGM